VKVRQLAAALAKDAPVRADDDGLPAADAVAVRLVDRVWVLAPISLSAREPEHL
jgi:hypothetical protein